MVFDALVLKLSVWCGDEGYVSGLRAAAAARKPDPHRACYGTHIYTHTHTHTHIHIYIYMPHITEILSEILCNLRY